MDGWMYATGWMQQNRCSRMDGWMDGCSRMDGWMDAAEWMQQNGCSSRVGGVDGSNRMVRRMYAADCRELTGCSRWKEEISYTQLTLPTIHTR